MGFGTHMVHEGHITTHQLVRALKRQQHLGTPIDVLAEEEGLLTVEQVLYTLNHQQKHPGLSFARAAHDLALLTQDESNTLHRRQARSRPGLGDILVSEGLVPKDTVTRELSRYASTKNRG